MRIRSLFLAVVFLSLAALGLSKLTHPAPTSACSWVVTSCGSGCSDNKDLYNCSNNVSVKSVSPSNSNPDSNNKAKVVAPPVVNQYIDGDASKVTPTAKEVISNPNQQVGSGTKVTDDTGMGGDIKESVGQTPTITQSQTVVQGEGNVAGSTSTPGVCPSNSITAGSCRGKPYGTSYAAKSLVSGNMARHVCVPTVAGCGLVEDDGKRFSQDSASGVIGFIEYPPGNPGNCTSVITCGCATGVKQHCVSTDPTVAPPNINPATQCANYTCPAVGSGNKVCEPGHVQCTSGTKGKVCKSDGSGYIDQEVEAHACGSTKIYAQSYCTNQAGKEICFSTYDACNKVASGACSVKSGVTSVTEATRSCSGNQSYSVFVGCGTGAQSTYNCYIGCNAGKTYGKTCVNQPGLSCGARSTTSTPPPQPPASNPPASNPPASNPPGSPPPPSTPRPSPTPSPQPGQCVSISKSVQAPKLGDQVSFTCTTVNLATRYEFRYAYATSNTVSENQYQALQPTSATANTSQPITVGKVGRYVAMCRPCFGNNQCESWQVATLQEQN